MRQRERERERCEYEGMGWEGKGREGKGKDRVRIAYIVGKMPGGVFRGFRGIGEGEGEM